MFLYLESKYFFDRVIFQVATHKRVRKRNFLFGTQIVFFFFLSNVFLSAFKRLLKTNSSPFSLFMCRFRAIFFIVFALRRFRRIWTRINLLYVCLSVCIVLSSSGFKNDLDFRSVKLFRAVYIYIYYIILLVSPLRWFRKLFLLLLFVIRSVFWIYSFFFYIFLAQLQTICLCNKIYCLGIR